MDLIGNGLSNLGRQLPELFLAPGSLFSITSLICALSISMAFLVASRLKRRTSWRALQRALFPRRIVRHASTRADAVYMVFNTFVYASTFGLIVTSYNFITSALVTGLNAGLGPMDAPPLPEAAQRIIITVTLFLAYEIGYWLDHYLKHHVPFLWEFHKVHHTAEVLTPMTAFRTHPMDTLIFGHILAIAAAIGAGFCAWLFGDKTSAYLLSGHNVILVFFGYIYIHLQHTHLWIPFRGAIGHIFFSPAHHQIHHSTNPKHFNKNFGSCLALWDWAFGTLEMPAQKRERLTFGVAPACPNAHTATGEFLLPFGRALKTLRFGLHRPAAPLSGVSQPAA